MVNALLPNHIHIDHTAIIQMSRRVKYKYIFKIKNLGFLPKDIVADIVRHQHNSCCMKSLNM